MAEHILLIRNYLNSRSYQPNSQVFLAVGLKARVQIVSLLNSNFNPVTVCSGTNSFRAHGKSQSVVGQTKVMNLQVDVFSFNLD